MRTQFVNYASEALKAPPSDASNYTEKYLRKVKDSFLPVKKHVMDAAQRIVDYEALLNAGLNQEDIEELEELMVKALDAARMAEGDLRALRGNVVDQPETELSEDGDFQANYNQLLGSVDELKVEMNRTIEFMENYEVLDNPREFERSNLPSIFSLEAYGEGKMAMNLIEEALLKIGRRHGIKES